MSQESDDKRLAELELEAGEARSRLKDDIEALAHMVSPEHLKQEALEVASDVAHSAKVAVTRWSGQATVVARAYWLPATVSLGFGGLLFAGVSRRNVPLLLSAVACGACAFTLGLRKTRERARYPQTAERRMS